MSRRAVSWAWAWKTPAARPSLRRACLLGFRIGDRGLIAAKVAVLALAAVVAGARIVRARLPQTVANPAKGIEMRYPGEWTGFRGDADGLLAWGPAPAGDYCASRPEARPMRVVSLNRVRWDDCEAALWEGTEYRPRQGWLTDEAILLAEIAAAFGMQGPVERVTVERVQMGGRTALMMTGPSCDGWQALVVAPGEDLAYLCLYAPTSGSLRRFLPQWKAMIRSVRLREPGDMSCPYSDVRPPN